MTGWDQGCLTMKLGEIAKLTIPGELGYGAGGFPAWGYPSVYNLYVQCNSNVCVVCVCACVQTCMCVHSSLTIIITIPPNAELCFEIEILSIN